MRVVPPPVTLGNSPDVTRAKLVLEDTRSPRVTRKTDMVPALGLDCDTSWRLWPAVHTAAISDGNVMVLKLFASVGNLFLMLGNAIKVRTSIVLYSMYPIGYMVPLVETARLWKGGDLLGKQITYRVIDCFQSPQRQYPSLSIWQPPSCRRYRTISCFHVRYF